MKFLLRLLIVSALLLIVLAGVLFSVQNTVQVPLDLLVISLPERSVALWVLLAFASGGLIGMLISMGMIWRLRASLLGANRRLRKLQTPIQIQENTGG